MCHVCGLLCVLLLPGCAPQRICGTRWSATVFGAAVSRSMLTQPSTSRVLQREVAVVPVHRCASPEVCNLPELVPGWVDRRSRYYLTVAVHRRRGLLPLGVSLGQAPSAPQVRSWCALGSISMESPASGTGKTKRLVGQCDVTAATSRPSEADHAGVPSERW